MSENKYDNASRYIYTGPSVLIPWAKPSKKYVCVNEGTEVVAEMNIAKATVIAVHRCGMDILTEPTFVASEYLKLKSIHFNPKDYAHIDTKHFFDDLFGDIAKMQGKFGNIFGEDFNKEPSKETLDYLRKYARRQQQDENSSDPLKYVMNNYSGWVMELLNALDFVVEIDGGVYTSEDGETAVKLYAIKSNGEREIICDVEEKEFTSEAEMFRDALISILNWLVEKEDDDYFDEFSCVLAKMRDTHIAKNHDYGNSFSTLFKECGMTYAYGHLKEKLERIKTLMKSRQQVKQESMLDSLYDLANYAVMTIVELKKKQNHE